MLLMADQRRLHAPEGDGEILAVPPLREAAALIERNAELLQHSPIAILGRPVAELRRAAFPEITAVADAYAASLGLPQGDKGSRPGFIVTGHQPELFHPGVWVKNFAAYGLARRTGLTPLNLVVDS